MMTMMPWDVLQDAEARAEHSFQGVVRPKQAPVRQPEQRLSASLRAEAISVA
jgi:hypothetical protein